MADNENLEDIRISELPETNIVSGSNDYLAVIKPSPLYTSGYKTFKVKAANLPGGGGGASSADDVTYDNTTSGLTADNVQEAIDELAQGGGGSTVEVTQIQTTGTKIATITVDSVGTDLYAPNGGGSASALDDLTDVAISSPTNNQALIYDSANSQWVNGTVSGGSGGHTIVDDSGTALTQRTNLQFKGAYSDDNSTDDTTEVNVIREMTKADFNQLSNAEKQGLIYVNDEIGGGLKYIKDTLFENVDESNLTILNNGDTISLSDNILDYDEIYFEGCFYESGNATGKKITHLAVTKVMRDTIAFAKSKYGTGQYEGMFDVAHNFIVSGQTYCFMYCLKVPTDNSFYVAFKYVNGWNGNSCTLTRIIGVKYLSESENTYSEDEQIVGKWIDGSTIYEKTISTSNSTVDLTSLSISALVKIEGTILHTNGKITPISYSSSGSDFAVPVYDVSSKILSLAGYGTSQGGTWTFTIRYTKAST